MSAIEIWASEPERGLRFETLHVEVLGLLADMYSAYCVDAVPRDATRTRRMQHGVRVGEDRFHAAFVQKPTGSGLVPGVQVTVRRDVSIGGAGYEPKSFWVPMTALTRLTVAFPA